MSIKTYRVWMLVIIVIVAGLAGWAVSAGNAYIPGPAVIAGAAILYFLRKRVKTVVEDERIYRIGDQASRLTIVIALVVMAVTGSTLMALSTDGRHELEIIGMTIGYSVCAILVLYTVLYNYISRKFGG
jgi:uncharacterized membrane protein